MIERLRERPFPGAVIAAPGEEIGIGKQIVPLNAAALSVCQPISVTA